MIRFFSLVYLLLFGLGCSLPFSETSEEDGKQGSEAVTVPAIDRNPRSSYAGSLGQPHKSHFR